MYFREFFEIIEPREEVFESKKQWVKNGALGIPQEREENAEMESLIETA